MSQLGWGLACQYHWGPDSPVLSALCLDAEAEDGYHRDQNVFGPGVTIEDDMAVLVRYVSGATLTYHLTA